MDTADQDFLLITCEPRPVKRSQYLYEYSGSTHRKNIDLLTTLLEMTTSRAKHLYLVWSFGVSVCDMAHIQEQDKSFFASVGSVSVTLSWVVAIPSLDEGAYEADRKEEIARNDERGTV